MTQDRMVNAIREPFVAMTYGPIKCGKTVDLGYSFPRALFVAAPGALDSIASVCGYMPFRAEVADIRAGTELIKQEGKKGKYETIVFDDFSFLSEQTFSMLEKDMKLKGFKLWGELRDIALEFRNEARYAKVNVVANAWEGKPTTKPDGTFVRGGPQLAGKLPESIPALCDVVLRAMFDANRKPWPAVYRCFLDPSWIMGDRLDVASRVDPAPMNLGELIRAAGRDVPRHPMLPNQEAEVQAISDSLSGVPKADMELVNQVFAKLVERGDSPRVARWTMRDAIDRAVIRNALKAQVLRFYDTGQSGLLG